MNELEANKVMQTIENLHPVRDRRDLADAYKAQQAREERIYWDLLDKSHLTFEQWYAFEAMQTWNLTKR